MKVKIPIQDIRKGMTFFEVTDIDVVEYWAQGDAYYFNEEWRVPARRMGDDNAYKEFVERDVPTAFEPAPELYVEMGEAKN